MNSENKNLFIIVGLGSIGKRHAEYYANLNGDLIFIDPMDNVFGWAKTNIKKDFKFFKKISEAKSFIVASKLPKLAVISNWGNQHFSTLLDLKKFGISKFFIEKPVANALYQIDNLLDMVKNKEINFVAGFGWRHSGLPDKIKEISTSYLGGIPQSISMAGGAYGVVTNGIHYLDIAISVFDSNPLSVFSDLKNDKINPRSNELDFWQGVSIWSFPDNKKLIISASNQSSVSPLVEIICPKGKIIINEDMSVSTFKRDASEIENDPRVIRLGKAFKQKKLDYMPDYSNVNNILIEPLINNSDSSVINEEREVMATKGIIYSLISSLKGQKINISDKVEDKYYNREWMIS